MELVITLKAGTSLAQAEELFEELVENTAIMSSIEDIRIQPGEI